MVDNLHDFLCKALVQAVVDAGHGVQDGHGGAIDGAAHYVDGFMLPDSHHHAQHQSKDAKGPSHDVGYHVENLFPRL